MVLRDYQEECVSQSVYRLKKKFKPGIACIATGGGKSHIIAAIADRLNAPCLILQPNQDILLQNYDKYISNGFQAGIWSFSAGRKELDTVTFATIGSIKDYEPFKVFKYVIIDEVDVVNPKKDNGMYMKLLKVLDPAIIGMTATPYRLIPKYFPLENNETLVSTSVSVLNHIPPYFFGSIYFKKELGDLITENYLCPIKYKQVGSVSTSLKLNSAGSDFTIESLDIAAFEKKTLLFKLIEHCLKTHKKTLIFLPSVYAVNKLSNELNELGILNGVVTSETSPEDRRTLINDFKEGKFQLMLNMGVFTVGADFPDCDSLILNRYIISPRLYMQIGGRILRKDPLNPNKVAFFYDLTDTVRRIGVLENIRLEKDDWKNIVTCIPINARKKDMTKYPLYSFVINKNL